MRITALVKSLDHVCCRYRVAAYRPYFEQAGHRLEIIPCPRGWFSGFRLPAELKPTDVLLVQRRLLSAWQLGQLRRQARWLVYDFDDAVFARDSFAARGLHSDRRLRGFVGMVQAADAVVAGNAFLRDQAAMVAPAERVHIIQTCLDVHRYGPAEHRPRERIRLVWIGAASTLRGLQRIRPILEAIGRRIPGASLKVICDRPLHLQHLSVTFVPWSEETEAAELADTDVGINWLPDDLWSQGKCGLKILQYMAAGLPVIANAVGVQADLVRHGETGLVAESASEWLSAVEALARDPELRRRLGQAGRRRVLAEFSVEGGAARWLNILASLECRPHSPCAEVPAHAARRPPKTPAKSRPS